MPGLRGVNVTFTGEPVMVVCGMPRSSDLRPCTPNSDLRRNTVIWPAARTTRGGVKRHSETTMFTVVGGAALRAALAVKLNAVTAIVSTNDADSGAKVERAAMAFMRAMLQTTCHSG